MTADQQQEIVLLYVPCPDLETAKRLGRGAVERRLAGCANILPAMVSLYEWEGRLEESGEAVLIAKTAAAQAPALRTWLLAEHPYEVPAVLTLAVADINTGYRDWLLGQMNRAIPRLNHQECQ